MSTQVDTDDPHRLADSNYTKAKVGVYSRAMVSITECDLRPLPVDIPVSHRCVPYHSWNSLCSVYLGKMIHCLKTKREKKTPESIVLPVPPPPNN